MEAACILIAVQSVFTLILIFFAKKCLLYLMAIESSLSSLEFRSYLLMHKYPLKVFVTDRIEGTLQDTDCPPGKNFVDRSCSPNGSSSDGVSPSEPVKATEAFGEDR